MLFGTPEHFIFLSIVAVTLVMGFIDAFMVRGITYYAARTDNEHIVKTAAQIERWGQWPSGMHQFSSGKAHMKEFAVAMLAVVQKFLRDKSGDYPLVFLCILSNMLSAVLIYLIAASYWTVEAGVLAFALYMTSFWPKLIALWGGIVLLAQVNALVTVYFLQLAETTAHVEFVWYALAGFAMGLMLFSSASSRKYIPLCLAAFYFSLRKQLNPSFDFNIGLTFTGTAVMSFTAFVLIGVLALRLNLNAVVTSFVEQKAPSFLKKFIPISQDKRLDHYLALAQKASHLLTQTAIFISLYLLANLVISQTAFYWLAQFSLFIGLGLAFFVMTYPNVMKSLKGYYFYSQYGKPIWRSRFYSYKEYFASIGKPIQDDMRGAGWIWLHRFFHQVIPLTYYLSLISVLVLAGLAVWPVLNFKMFAAAVAVAMISFSPVFIGELTKGVQVGRSYFPAFVGFFILIGFSFASLQKSVSPEAQTWLGWGTFGIVVLSGIWNTWVYLADVYPSRMATKNLIQALRELKIRKFYTYDTPYNEVFVNSIPPSVRGKFEIEFICTLKDIREGFVVVPGTNSTASIMYDFPLARSRNRKFEADPYLNDLIETKEIKRFAVRCFKTLASSRIWVHEGEVPSYRDLILKEITDEDRWRGHGWLLKI